MVDSIKITALQDIGANIAYTTLVPLVNMAGTPTTQKANLQNLGNLILNGAGGSYFARAAQANIALSVANAAQPNITSVGTLSSLAVTGNITAGNINGGNIVVANFYYGDGGFLTNVASNGSYSNSNVANYLPTYTGNVGAANVVSAGNLNLTANALTWNFTDQGVLSWPGGIGQIDTNNSTFEIHSTNGLMISTNEANSSQSFLFATDGTVTCPANATFEGTRLNVGPGAANVPLATNPTLVVTDNGAEFIQAAIINENPNGSSDFAAYGADADETQGFADLGYAGHNFNDPNYSITPPGDGYVFVQGYANGIGGQLVLATGQNGLNPDIVFATGGFTTGAEFGRIDHANNLLYLSRGGSGIKFSDGTIQTTAGGAGTGDITFNGPNISTNVGDGNINIIGSTSGNVHVDSNNHIFLHVDDSFDPHGGIEMSWARTSNGVERTAGISINTDYGNTELATGNVQIVACSNLANGIANSSWTFGTDGKLAWPGVGSKYLGNGAAGEFEIHSDANVVIGTDIGNGDRLFVFDQAGDFYAPGNVALEGTNVLIGPGANTLGLSDATLVISSTSNAYIQAVINNVSDAGSADWVAQGRLGSDLGGYVDLGFNSSGFSDPEYSSMGPGDGYLYTEGYAVGQAPLPTGGNLVIGTGSQGLTRDVIFTTGGHTTEDIIARFSDANNLFELSRANSGIKFPDGSIQTTANVGSAGQLINGDNSFVLAADGNVVFEGDITGNAINRGLVWDYGANANGVNSEIRQDNGGLTVRAWTENGGGANGYSATVNIVTNQDADEKQWVFDGDGNLTLPGNLRIPAGNIVSDELSPAFNSAITGITTGNVTVIVTLADGVFGDPVQGQVTISGVVGTTEANGIWYYEAVEGNAFELFTDNTYTTPIDGTSWTPYVSGGNAASTGAYSNLAIQSGNVLINGNLILPGNGYIVNPANSSLDPINPNVSTMIFTPDSGYSSQSLVLDPTAPGHIHLRAPGANIDEPLANIFLGGEESSFEVGYYNGSAPNVFIHSGGNTWTFDTTGSTIYPTLTVTRGDRTGTLTGQTLLFGDSMQEAIISTPNGTNDINASQRFVINPGAGATGTTGEGGDIYLYAGRGGDAGGSGGDIKVRGGLAPADGTGGYLDIQGGDTLGNGTGGYIDIRGGESGNAIGGAVNLYGGYGPTIGGNVTITGGQSGTGAGGNVIITGGTGGDGLSTYGSVSIASGASTWAFDNTGNLTLPGNTVAINFANGSAALSNLVQWTTAPTANTDPGTAGQAAYDSGGNLYVCVTTNTWAKFAGTTSW
jgi:hypothetical protein